VAFSPDGNYLVTGNDDNGVRLWDLSQLPWPTRLTEHVNRVNAVAFALDGKNFATGSGDGAIRLWDTRGTVLQRLDAHEDGTTALAFAATGRLASAGGDGRILLWQNPLRSKDSQVIDVKSGKLLALSFSPTGETLVAGCADQQLRWWNVAGAKPVALGQLALPAGARVALFSPDGKTVAYGGGNGVLYLADWDGRSLKQRFELSAHRQGLVDAAFAPDGKTLLSGGMDGALKLWDTATGKVVQEWPDVRFPIQAVAFAPDGRHAAVASANGSVHVLRLDRFKPAAS
jgi:WD40 repeat protein